jgi:hypothetical protein
MRAHRAIGNSRHRVPDVTFDEDRACNGNGHGPENRLCFRNRVTDSSLESSVVAVLHEQTDTPDLQDPELAGL